MQFRDAFVRELELRPVLWVVMEYCPGGSVRDLIRAHGSPLDDAPVGFVCSSVLAALAYLHRMCRAIHRDVKAANILLTEHGDVKLADFGVSARLSGTLTKRNTVIGSAPQTVACAPRS